LSIADLAVLNLSDISDFLAGVIVPGGAVGMAFGVVRGAKALEKDASDQALNFVSGLLVRGNVADFGKLGAAVVPIIFDRLFGSRPFTFQFVFRSFVATTLFWLALLAVRHPDWPRVWQDIEDNMGIAWLLIPGWYVIDWLSLTKARFLIRMMSQRYALTSLLLFFILDVTVSMILPIFTIEISTFFVESDIFYKHFDFKDILLIPYFGVEKYISLSKEDIRLVSVLYPSTLFTSFWTLFLLISIMVSKILAPLEYLRRFMVWWFRDVDQHPLIAIAKVAAALLVIGAVAIKWARWL
jgi:hypothetical protein